MATHLVPSLDALAADRHIARVRSMQASSWLNEEVAQRMLSRLDWMNQQPKRWLHWEPAWGGLNAHRLLTDKLGSGQLAKMVNQICIAGIAQGLSEALNFAMRAGLDPDDVVDVISKGAAQSWQMENRAKTMVRNEFEFGFAVEWMRKDLGICFDEASRNGAQLPMTEMVDKFYAEVVAMGGKRWDTSSLIARLTD